MVCLSVCVSISCTGRDVVYNVNSWGLIKGTCVRWRPGSPTERATFVGHSLLVRSAARLGSGAGPILFVLHTVDLISLIESHGLSTHLYADDTQVYGSCRSADVVSFSTRLPRCADETSSWRSQTDSSRTLTKPKFFGVLQVGARTNYRPPHC